MRIDARSRPAADYISRAIQCLDEEGCAGVAGVQIARGETKAGRVHALALNHLLGGGGAHYRSAKQRRESETLYLGFYSSEWLRRVGGWSEEFAANEDYENCPYIPRTLAVGYKDFDPVRVQLFQI